MRRGLVWQKLDRHEQVRRGDSTGFYWRAAMAEYIEPVDSGRASCAARIEEENE
jgi:hypothetical protein